ncbi:glycerate kinase [Ulvibacterium marinum]|uniref:glycerate kinase n=1 Tax=Ulvibacterium marinum TaxID=2419782 RepID=UPI00249551D1|nr:glycerate kinase [Ulvibacterium marinum]
MNILIIPDKFKGSLAASEVISAISNGIQKVMPNANLHSVMSSDGGDGFLNAVAENLDCEVVTTDTVDPLGRRIRADYLLNRAGHVAYIELAKSSGLELLQVHELSVMKTSTYGTGLQIRDAITKGATSIYVGLGGSATNDGGTGIALALGYQFLDGLENNLDPNGENLSKIRAIKKKEVVQDLNNISFYAVNDVDNPLFGAKGAAHIYARQKGANDSEIDALDEGLRNLDAIVQGNLGKNMAQRPGAGAAGGTAYGLQAFLNAEFVSGIDFMLNLAHVEELLQTKKIDYIITGEGKFDNQTLHGKLIKGVVDLGKNHGVPVIVVCGQSEVATEKLASLHITEVLEISDASKPLEYNMENAAALTEKTVLTFFENLTGA